MMNKQDLVASIAKKSGLTKADSQRALEAMLSTVNDSLSNGKGVRLIGFGSFRVAHRAARRGRNPQTGAKLTIAARNVPQFHAGRDLKKAVNK